MHEGLFIRPPALPPPPALPFLVYPDSRIFVSQPSISHEEDISWVLTCGGINIANGGAPYDNSNWAWRNSLHVYNGTECELSMTDSYGDGWNATWQGLGHSLTLAD